MSDRQDIADAYAEAWDAEREVLYADDASLVLVLNAGTETESEFEISDGWISERQQKFGEVASVRLIKITEREGLTADVMSQADRLRLSGVVHNFNFDPPVEDPWWTLYATEMKAGGLR